MRPASHATAFTSTATAAARYEATSLEVAAVTPVTLGWTCGENCALSFCFTGRYCRRYNCGYSIRGIDFAVLLAPFVAWCGGVVVSLVCSGRNSSKPFRPRSTRRRAVVRLLPRRDAARGVTARHCRIFVVSQFPAEFRLRLLSLSALNGAWADSFQGFLAVGSGSVRFCRTAPHRTV